MIGIADPFACVDVTGHVADMSESTRFKQTSVIT
jgi:hypothetical protein